MKRIMSILIIMLIGIQLAVYAADADNTDTNNTVNARYEMLSSLDLIEPVDVSDNETISRAKFISNILKFSDNAVAAENATGNSFVDVDKDYAYAAQIERGAELGYMTGYSDGEFYPESPITYTQAVKVIVSMLGYDLHADKQGGYPDGYLAVAASIDLTKGVKQLDDELTTSSLVTLLYNACEIPVVIYDASNKEYKKGKGDNDTALYYFHNIAKVKGVVTANDVTGLNNESESQSEGYIMLDGEAMDAGITAAKSFLGYSVTAYVYYENENETGVVKYITADAKNKVLAVDSKNIMSEDDAFSGTNFVYENENRARRTVRIKPETAIIFNGKAKPLYSVADLAVALGDVTFIDNNNDGTYDCVNIFSATKVIIPEFIAEDDDNITIIDYFNSSNKYSYSKDYKYYDVDIDGEKVSYVNIKKDMIVLVGENNSGTSEHSVTRAYSKDTKIAGVVNVKAEDEVNISGTVYDYSPFLDKSRLKLNGIGYFWVHGDVVYGYQKSDIEIDGRMLYVDDYEYGYMISAVYADEGEPEPMLQLKLLTSYNEFEKYRATDSTKYNGKKIKDRYEAAKLFADSWSGDNFRFKPQIVKYKLDEEKNLKEIYTAAYPEELKYEGNVNTEFRDENNRTVIRVEKDGVVSLIDKSNIAQYGFYVDTWLNFFYQDDDTIVFHINDGDLEESFASGKFPSASTPNDGKFVHDFYNVDEDKNTVAAVVWHSNLSQDRQQVERGAQPMIVKKVVDVMNSDGDIVKEIDGIMNGVSVGIQYNDKMTSLNKQIFDSIGIGDIIFYDIDGKGVITAIEKSLDARRLGEYGMSNNPMFDAVHDSWAPPVHLYRKVGYYKIEDKLHNNFYSYKNGEGALCVQLADPAARFYKYTLRGNKVFVNEITYSEVVAGDEVFAMFEYNKLQTMIVINAEG